MHQLHDIKRDGGFDRGQFAQAVCMPGHGRAVRHRVSGSRVAGLRVEHGNSTISLAWCQDAQCDLLTARGDLDHFYPPLHQHVSVGSRVALDKIKAVSYTHLTLPTNREV